MSRAGGKKPLISLLVALVIGLSALFFPADVAGSNSRAHDTCSTATCYIGLTSPANGAVIPYSPGMTITFSWFVTFVCGGDCSNDQLEVKIGTDQSLAGVVQDKYAGACNPQCPTSWTSQPFAAAGTYYWQVSTRADPQINPVSPVWSFTLSGQSSGGPGTTFHDAVGDSAYDITDVSVTNDAQPNVHFTISVPSRPTAPTSERVVVFIDSDLNSRTGESGWDIQLCTCGSDLTQMRLYSWNGSGWPQAASQPASLRVSYAGGWSVDVLERQLGLGASFRFAVSTFQRNGSTDTVDDRAPDSGSWTYNGSTPPPTCSSSDTTPPRARALASNVQVGKLGHLRYTVSDNCGKTSDHVVVYSKSKVVARITTRLSTSVAGRVYYVTWRVPRRPVLPLKFCVVAFDAAQNASSRSCARISVY